MENAKTPTGDSKTNKLTAEQAKARIEKSEQAMVTAAKQEELPEIVEVNVIVMEPAERDKTMTQLKDKTPDSITPIVAGTKGEKTEIVYENGQKLIPETQKPNESLQRAQTRIDTIDSANQKIEENQNVQDTEVSTDMEDEGRHPGR